MVTGGINDGKILSDLNPWMLSFLWKLITYFYPLVTNPIIVVLKKYNGSTFNHNGLFLETMH